MILEETPGLGSKMAGILDNHTLPPPFLRNPGSSSFALQNANDMYIFKKSVKL
jgi:hypothetical protein